MVADGAGGMETGEVVTSIWMVNARAQEASAASGVIEAGKHP